MGDKIITRYFAFLFQLRDSNHVKYIEEDGIVRALWVNSWGQGRVDQRNMPLDGNTPSFLGKRSQKFSFENYKTVFHSLVAFSLILPRYSNLNIAY